MLRDDDDDTVARLLNLTGPRPAGTRLSGRSGFDKP